MKADEQRLLMHTALTKDQFYILKDIYNGVPNVKIAKNTLKAIRPLINDISSWSPQYTVTPGGAVVYRRALGAIVGNMPFLDLPDIPPRVITRVAKDWKLEWFKNSHAKLLYGLVKIPDQEYTWLRKIYGRKTIDELRNAYLITGNCEKFHILYPTPAGRQLIMTALGDL